MKYTSFYIKNYKGIQELTLELNREPKTNIFTLVGLNESGKTTVLEAISVLQDKKVDVSNIHKLIPKSQKASFSDTIEIHCTLELDPEDMISIRKIKTSLGINEIQEFTKLTVRRIFKFTNSAFLEEGSGLFYDFALQTKTGGQRTFRNSLKSSAEYEGIKKHMVEQLIPPIIYYPNFLFDFPDRIYLEKSINEDEEQETYRAVLNDILDSTGDGWNIKDQIVDRLKLSNDANNEALEAVILNLSSKITSVVFTAWDQLFRSGGKEIVLKAGIDQSKNLPFLEFKLKEGTQQFQISERSLGFKWFFTFLLFTEFRKNRQAEKGEILFLLDEPASNLHSTAQKKLLKTFENLVSNCKLIYTTHSHHLINPVLLSGTYIVRNKAINYEDVDAPVSATDIEAVIYKQFVTTHPEQRTYFQPILDSIEYSPSSLEEVPNIVLTEGKNDYYTFRYMAEVILKEEDYDIKFYPGNGADRNNQIIATYLAWGRDFTILLDGDKAGEDAKTRYIKEFGVVVQSSIITLKDVDASFNHATEQLFTGQELLEIQKTFDPTATAYSKSAFNTALQNLFISQQVVTLSKETTEKFKKVLDFLK